MLVFVKTEFHGTKDVQAFAQEGEGVILFCVGNTCHFSVGMEFQFGNKLAKVNVIKNHSVSNIVRFWVKYNSFDTGGYRATLDKPYATLHDKNIVYSPKEANAFALA